MKAASIFLRSEITAQDVLTLIRWLDNPRVTRYLNEDACVCGELRALLLSSPEPLLGYHLSRGGPFYLVCHPEAGPIGFVKLNRSGFEGSCEIVFAIGEDGLWGNGYGRDAVEKALELAFFEHRTEQLIAKVYTGNTRAARCLCACGFAPVRQGEKLCCYSLSAQQYRALLLA